MDLGARSTDAVPYSDPRIASILLSGTLIRAYFHVVTAMLLFYDIITTLDKEVRYFWLTPWNNVNYVYFSNRYVGLLGALSLLYWNTLNANDSNAAGWLLGLSNLITRIVIDYALMLRVLALYCGDRRMSISLRTLFIIEECLRIGVFFWSMVAENVSSSQLATNITLCTVTPLPLNIMVVVWIIPMVYEVLVMGLALHKAVEFWRISAGFSGLTLVKIVMFDQVIYFCLVVASCIFNMLQITLHGTDVMAQNVIAALGSSSFLSVLGSHMLLNLKEAGERGLNEGTSYRVSEPSEDELIFN